MDYTESKLIIESSDREDLLIFRDHFSKILDNPNADIDTSRVKRLLKVVNNKLGDFNGNR